MIVQHLSFLVTDNAAANGQRATLPGVPNIPLGELQDRISEIPVNRPLVLQCQGGARSMMAAAVLQANGVREVIDLTDDYGAWKKDALPTRIEEA